MKTSFLSDPAKAEVVERTLRELATAYPDLTRKELVQGPLAEAAFGPLPPYSNRHAHQISNVTTATIGSFVLCYAVDTDTQITHLLLIRRRDRNRKNQAYWGVPGGYTVLDKINDTKNTPTTKAGEQPKQGAVREFGEEIIDDQGHPVLNINPERLSLIIGGIDYRHVTNGGLPVHYDGHTVELTPDEFVKLHQHTTRMHTDTLYRAAVKKKSEGEVTDVMLTNIDDAVSLGRAQFFHPHEHDAVCVLQKTISGILPKKPSRSIPYAAPHL